MSENTNRTLGIAGRPADGAWGADCVSRACRSVRRGAGQQERDEQGKPP